jgi:hypothetical protein
MLSQAGPVLYRQPRHARTNALQTRIRASAAAMHSMRKEIRLHVSAAATTQKIRVVMLAKEQRISKKGKSTNAFAPRVRMHFRVARMKVEILTGHNFMEVKAKALRLRCVVSWCRRNKSRLERLKVT